MPIQIELPIQKIRQYCKSRCIRRLAVFGSALRNDFLADSDLDLLVEFQPGTRTGLRFFAIQDELSQLLGRTVDLSTPGFLSPYFREHVMSEAATIYEEG